jgi:2-C-methyl-D-erythritol 4-phosphate cytidylyltransferase
VVGVSPTAALVLLAAGSGARSGLSTNKVFAALSGRRVLTWSLDATRDLPGIDPVMVVVRPEEATAAERVLREESPGREVGVVAGGPTRHASERNALESIRSAVDSGEVDVVVVHDAARPLAPTAVFADVVTAAREHGGAVPGRLQQALLRRSDLRPFAGEVLAVQTPQAFGARLLLDAHDAAAAHGFEGTDTAACVERFAPWLRIHALPAPATNLKITFPEDLALAERLVARRVR